LQPGTAARVPTEQASDARQPHAPAKVRTPPRQASNATIEANIFLAAQLAPALQHGWQRRGKPKLFQLVDPTETRIRRYVKVKSEANPFDPRWRDYFEDRHSSNVWASIAMRPE
jgi:hypothetical protein